MEIKKGSIVRVITPNHTVSNSLFLFEDWTETGFKGKKHPNRSGNSPIYHVSQAQIEIVSPSEVNEIVRRLLAIPLAYRIS